MDRFFVNPEEWDEERIVLRGDEAHHCLRVMRKVVGDRVELFDGEGRWAEGELVEASGREATLSVREHGVQEALRPGLILMVAIPKGKTMDLVVQKAVELGVAEIRPLVTERTVVRVDRKDGVRKQEKWQRIALE